MAGGFREAGLSRGDEGGAKKPEADDRPPAVNG